MKKYIQLPKEPEKDGYIFVGWYFDEGIWQNEFKSNTYENKPLDSEINVYAFFCLDESKEYSIKYILDGGENNVNNPNKYIQGQKIDLYKPFKEYYDFMGWFDKYNTKIDSIDKNMSGDISLCAKWKIQEGYSYCRMPGYTASPYIPYNSYIIGNKNVNISDLNVGDFITFRSSPTSNNFITHMIVAIKKDGYFQADESVTIVKDGNEKTFNSFSEINFGNNIQDCNIITQQMTIDNEGIDATCELLNFERNFYSKVIKVETAKDNSETELTENGLTFIVKNDKCSLIQVDNSLSEEIIVPIFVGEYIVQSIDESALKNNKKIKNIIMFDTIQSVSLINCDGLESIVIPGSVTNIYIEGCNNLNVITLGSDVECIKSYVFKDCPKLKCLTIPDGITTIGDYAFSDCSSLTSITLPNSIKSIGKCAFSDCSSLTSITIPDSVSSIGDSAFSGCSSLTGITIPDSVTSIGSYAFYNCSSLTSITIPDSVSSIGDGAFSGCSSLTSITIPDSVTSIGDSAFSGCSSLISIIIPDRVTTIGFYAFSGCSSLAILKVEEGNKIYHSAGNCIINTKNKILIAGCKTSIIPNDGSVTSIGRYAFSGCNSLTTITIPDSVISIGDGAFSGCSSLTTITIPDRVTTIGFYAFSGCSSLSSIIIPESVTSIGYYAFYYCTSLTIYCEATSQQTDWTSTWNNSNRPVYWYSETKPTMSGNYWHYVDGVVTKW